MVSVEELKQRFAVSVIAPWGNCLVIPKKAFMADWEKQLYDQGFGCVFTNMGSEQVVLVRLSKLHAEKAEGERVVFVPKPQPEPRARISPVSPTASTAAIVKHDVSEKVANLQDPARRWTEADDDLLVLLWKKEPKLIVAEIAKSFPKRSLGFVQMELSRLQKAEKIVSRFKHRAAHGHDTHMGSGWTDEGYSRLMELWNAGKSLDEIAAEFPGRSFPAIKQTLTRLRRAGKIKSRAHGRPPGRAKEIQTKHDAARFTAPSRPPGESNETKSAAPIGSGPGPMPPPSPSVDTPVHTETPMQTPKPLPFTVSINIDVRVDCGNPASVEAFKKLLKELTV